MHGVRRIGKRALRKSFEMLQPLGVNVLPNHYYSQVPEVATLRREQGWRKPLSMEGVQGADLAGQVEFLDLFCPTELTSQLQALDIHETAVRENLQPEGYGTVEAEFLYCYIRTQRPKRVVQVGCGVSTSIVLRAARDEGYEVEVSCIEPFPSAFLKTAQRSGQIRLVEQRAQDVELGEFLRLSDGDLLFVDSTHTVKVGSEVNRLLLEVMPRLASGVGVHFHDIYFPYDYPRNLLGEDLFFWSESTLLHAYLIHNARIGISVSLSMLHYQNPDSLSAKFACYEPQGNHDGLADGTGVHFPASTWLRCR